MFKNKVRRLRCQEFNTHTFQVQVQVDAQAEPQAQVFSLSLISMLTSNFEFNLKFYLTDFLG